MAKYVSGKFRKLQVGIKGYSEDKPSLTVIGRIGIGTETTTNAFDVQGDANITGILTAGQGVHVNGGDLKVGTAFTVSQTGIVTALKYYGDGSNLTGISADTVGDLANLFVGVSGISTLGTVKIANGIVTATSGVVTYIGDGSQLTGVSGNVSGINTVGVSTFTNIFVSGVSTFSSTIDSNGRIVGAATSNVIPFLYSNFTDLPSAATYHGAFAHVHATQKAYFAHGGAWYELVNKEANGIVGTGTEKYNVGVFTATDGTFSGNLSIGGTLTYEDVTNIDSVGVITARQGIVVVGGGVSVAAGGLHVTGVTTFNNSDVVFQGAAGGQNITFDASENDLEFTDAARIKFGNSDDLEIWHDAPNSNIKNSTGDFHIRSDSLALKTADNSERYLKATANEDVKLYYNGNEKFATTGYGISVTGGVNATGVVTASGFVGDGSGLTGVTASGTGVVIKDNGSAVGTAGTIDFSTNLDVTFNSGIATIVTNVDTGINTTGNSNFHNLVITGVTTAGIITGATYYGDGSNLTGVGTQGANVQAETLTVSGVSTFSGNINANGTLTVLNSLNANGNIIGDGASNISGINSVTATSFYGSGANLSNVTATGLTTTASVNTTGIITATSFYGDGTNLTGTGGGTLISGITVQDETSTVGTAGSIKTLDFQGASITATASGTNKAIITVTDSFSPDGQENLFAGTNAGACKDSDTCFNVGIGYSTGFALNAGDNNVLIGKESGSKCLTSGSFNIFLGCRTGQCSNSTCSIFLGNYAGRHIDGYDNIFLGSGAGRGIGASGKDACGNVALGAGAAACIDEGDDNVIIGRGSGGNTQSGGCNVFLGCCAGKTNTSGSHNIVLGAQAYSSGVNGFAGYNVLIGYEAGQDLSGGNNNIAIGAYAGCCLCNGAQNTLIGNAAGISITDGDYNIMLGTGAGRCLTTGCYNVYHGDGAGKANVTGNDNIALGRYAGYGNTSNGSTCHNISMGLWSGRCLTTGGNHNIQFGCYTNRDVTTGSYNIAIGHSVGVASSTGDYQLAIGQIDDRWITGDSSFNVSLSGIATITKSTGQFEARSFKGDGTNITGIITAGSALASGIATGGGTFTASAGVSTNIDSFAYGSVNYKTAEYTVHIENGANTQAQKVLIMQNGTTALSQEYAIMFSNSQLVSAGSTISSGNVLLQVTPETGISGLTTYRWRREVQL